MKKTISILTALLFNAICINAQVWQQTYGIPNHYEIANGTVNSYDNGYLVGINRDSKAVILLKADINGNLLWIKTFKDFDNNTISVQSISSQSNENIYITGGEDGTSGTKTYVFSIDNCGVLHWCKKIVFSDYNLGGSIKTTLGQNIRLLTFGVSDFLGIDRFQLWEFDPDGNIIWMKQVLPGTQTYFQNTSFRQMCLTSDSGSLMAGYTYYPYDTLNKPWDAILQPCLVKSNSQGEMQWVYPPMSGADTNRIGFFSGCTQINDTYYAVGSHYDTTEFFLRPLVARFSLDGQLLSYHYLLPDTLYMQLSNIISATDTSILLISATSNQVYSDPNHLVVFIADTMGNYKKSFTRNDLVVGHFGDNVARMKDNKFLIPCQSPLGWVGPLTDIVAIKLNANLEYDSIYTQQFTYDSLCPYPIVSDTVICNCEPFVSVKEAPKANEVLAIMPNPAKDEFSVRFLQTLQKAGTLRVYDMLGRVQYETILASGIQQIKINSGSWNAGLYLVRCQCGGKVMSGKVVVK